jgi:galactonate dehydratase
MKITSIKTFLVGNPWKNWLFVKVETDAGVHGIGEGTLGHFSKTVEAAIHENEHMVLGYDPFQVEAIVLRLSRNIFGDGAQIKMCAISAIEIGLWDIIGKALGQPIYNLLGGLCREKVRAYANGWYRCPRTPEDFARKAQEVVKAGYTAMKFDPFGTAWRKMERTEEDLSVEIVEAVREAVGPKVDLMIEAHARFGVATAIHIGKRLEPFSPAWYEDPVPHHNPEVTTEVARHLSIPVATGESLTTKHQFADLLRDDAIDIVTLEPLHVGGILGSRKISDLVDAHYGVIAPHSAQGPICTLACLQIAACTPNFYMQEYFDQFNVEWESQLLTWNPKFEKGYLEIPKRPGLGADLNMEVIQAHPYHSGGDITLWDKDWHFRRLEVEHGAKAARKGRKLEV